MSNPNRNPPRAPHYRATWAPFKVLPPDLQAIKDALMARPTNVQHVVARVAPLVAQST
jgi:hypothetical protein